MNTDFAESNLIFQVVTGSKLYGTSTPDSDTDTRGICVPPRKVVMGFASRFDQKEYSDEDKITYGLMKFMQLAAEVNPNILELLFAPKEVAIVWTPLWEKIVSRRHEFLSAKAYHTFSGYAYSQLKKVKSHRAHLLSPPTHKPTREEFGLTDSSLGLRELSTGVDAFTIDPQVVIIIQREKEYKAKLTVWNQYEEWKKSRNPARAMLEAHFGYDTKHAGHLIRLLRMGREILLTGEMLVVRPDASELLDIRNGKWTYDQLMANVDPLMAELEDIYESKRFVVPYAVNKEKLSDFCVELHEEYWSTCGK